MPPCNRLRRPPLPGIVMRTTTQMDPAIVPDAVAQCLRGEISAPVALSRLLLGGGDATSIASAIQAARPQPPSDPWVALNALVACRAAQLDRLAAEIRQTGSNHTALGGVAAIAAFFDRAAAYSPEAGVALYSLGDPALLQAATHEVVEWLLAGGLLRSDADVLDLGCGIGRVAAAVAPHCRSVLGLDVSRAMVAEARRRHPSLRFAQSDGAHVPPGPFGLVLLVDSMPYIIQAGVADAVVAGIAAALQPGGALVVLNLAYGCTDAQNDAVAARWAARHGWRVAASRPFRLWDGAAYVLTAAGLRGGLATGACVLAG